MIGSERKLKASFHGHSRYSDGLDSIETLVAEAARQRITHFGISDHNTTDGVPELYTAVLRINETGGAQIVPVSAIEIMTKQGDLIVAKPGERDDGFLDWAKKTGERSKRVSLASTITEAVNSFEAIAIVAHPGAPFMKAVSLLDLAKLKRTLDDKVRQNVGVEVKNWSTNIMLGVNPLRELVVLRLTDILGFAKFGFSDFHSHWQIGTQFTCSYTNDLTANGLLVATKNRKVYPSHAETLTPKSWAKLFITFAKTYSKI